MVSQKRVSLRRRHDDVTAETARSVVITTAFLARLVSSSKPSRITSSISLAVARSLIDNPSFGVLLTCRFRLLRLYYAAIK